MQEAVEKHFLYLLWHQRAVTLVHGRRPACLQFDKQLDPTIPRAGQPTEGQLCCSRGERALKGGCSHGTGAKEAKLLCAPRARAGVKSARSRSAGPPGAQLCPRRQRSRWCTELGRISSLQYGFEISFQNARGGLLKTPPQL